MSSFPAKPRNSLNAGLFAAIRKRLESSGIASNSDALNSLSRFPRHVSSLADSAKLEGFDDDLVISACTEFFRAQSLCTDHSLSEVVLIEDSDDDDFVELDKGSVYPPASVATATSPIVLSDSDVLESAPLAQRLKHKHGLNSPVGKHAAAAVAAAAPLVAKNQSTTRVIEDDSDSDFGSSSVDKGLSRVAVSLGPSVSRTLSSSSNASGGVFDLPRPAGAQPSRVSHFTKPVISASSLSSLNRSASLTGTAAATAAAAAAASAPTRSASSAAALSSGGGGSSGGFSASQTSSSGGAGRIEGPTAWSCPCCHRGFTLPLSPVDSGWTVDPSQPGGMPPTRPASCAAPAGSSLASSSSISSSAPVSVSAPPPHTCALDVACWEVVLLLDNREVRSQKDRGYMAAELQGRGVTVEVRALALGDIMWIARRREGAPRPVPPPHLLLQQQQQAKGDAAAEADAVTGASSAQAKPPKPRAKKAKKGDASSSSSEALGPVDDAPTAALKPSARRKKVAPAPAAAAAPSDCEWSWDPRPVRDETREWVLDAIIERKSVGDLAASIVDGRYIEQKTRLAESGLRVIYLVEGDPHKLVDNAGYGPRIGSKHIASAMVSTQVGNGFRVVSTHTLDATIAWLVKMHFTFVAAFNNGAKCEFARAAAGALSPPSSSSSSAVSSSSSSSAAAASAAPVRSSSYSGGVFASQSQSASQLQMHGDGGGAWSDGFALSQAAASASLALADPWCLIGGGERGGSGATTSSSSGSNAAAAVASAAAVLSYSDQQQLQHQQRHVCAYDRCALLGRPSLPRRLLPRSYAEHHTLASRPKVFTAMQLFGRMLRQVNGCSADRAHAVLALYPTPATLAAAFDALPQRDGPALLRNLPIPRQRKVIGPALSATLHDVFNSRPTAAAVSKRGPDASGSSSSSGGGGADTGFSERRLGSEDGDDDDDEEENEL